MSNKLPGVYITETDLSTTAEEVGGSVGLFVGLANKGMVNARTYIADQKKLIDTFGAPPKADEDYAVIGAHEYLSVSPVYFTRVTTDDMKYGKVEIQDAGRLAMNEIDLTPKAISNNLVVTGTASNTVVYKEVNGITVTDMNILSGGTVYSPRPNVSNSPTEIQDAEKELVDTNDLILFSTLGPDTNSDLVGITLENFETYAVSGEVSDVTISYKYDMVKSRLGDAVPTYNSENNPAPSVGAVPALSATTAYKYDAIVTASAGITSSTITFATNQRKSAGTLLVTEGADLVPTFILNGTKFTVWTSTSAVPTITGVTITKSMSGATHVTKPYWYAGFDSISGTGDVMVLTSSTINGKTVYTCPWFNKYDFVPNAITTDPTKIGVTGNIWQSVFKVNVFTRASNNVAFPASPTEVFYGTIGDVFGDDGTNLNIKNSINGKSKYVYVTTNEFDVNGYVKVPKNIVSKVYAVLTYNGDIKKASGIWSYQFVPVAFGKGNSGSTSSVGDYQTAYNLYTNKRDTKINLIVETKPEKAHAVLCDNLVSARKDCASVIQIGSGVNVSVDEMEYDDTSVSNPSYTYKYGGWVKVYDSYNRKYRWIPMNIMGARTVALCESQYKVSSAPAGVRRGVLPVLGVYKKYSDSEILRLYNKNINTSMWQTGIGHVLWGQRTALALNSALREISVRQVMLFIENSCEATLNGYLFEGNTANERLRITGNLSSFLSGVKGNSDIIDFLVICNESNNTPDVIDNQELNVAIAITPVRTMEVINLNVIITQSGVLLSEVAV